MIKLISNRRMACYEDLSINQELYLFNKACYYKVIQLARS